MSWVDSFKIALIQKDEKKIEKLFREMPQFEDIEQVKIAANMIDEARAFFVEKRAEVAKEMALLQKSKKFIGSSEKKSSRLNLMS